MNFRSEMLGWMVGLDRFAMVTVIEINGSAPSEIGTRMIVTQETACGSIGGGNLEFQAIHKARKLLTQSPGRLRETEFLGLGITRQQCCGGAVQLMYEVFSGKSASRFIREMNLAADERPRFLVSCVTDNRPARIISRRTAIADLPDEVWDFTRQLIFGSTKSSGLVSLGAVQWFVTHLNERPTKVVVFGAGHVGKALIKVLADLPFQIDWMDPRPEMFPQILPANARARSADDPFELIDQQPDDVLFVVLTHDHGLDYDLCLHILKQRKSSWLGLIGSVTKRRRFEQRLLNDGVDAFTLRRLVCPIGLPDFRSKYPSVIALSIAIQLLEVGGRMRRGGRLSGSDFCSEVRA